MNMHVCLRALSTQEQSLRLSADGPYYRLAGLVCCFMVALRGIAQDGSGTCVSGIPGAILKGFGYLLKDCWMESGPLGPSCVALLAIASPRPRPAVQQAVRRPGPLASAFMRQGNGIPWKVRTLGA